MKSREGRVNPRGDMISQHGADKFLRRMGEMRRQFSESTVSRRKDCDFANIGIIFGGLVEEVNKRFILVDDLGEGGGVFAGGEELVDGFIVGV